MHVIVLARTVLVQLGSLGETIFRLPEKVGLNKIVFERFAWKSSEAKGAA